MSVDKICLYLHYIVILAVLLAPFVIPLKLVPPYLVMVCIIIIHWYILDGKCFMSRMHTKSSNNNGPITDIYDKLNIKIEKKNVNILIDVLFFFTILFGFSRINKLKEGLLVVVLFILLNKQIYNSYHFRWITEDN